MQGCFCLAKIVLWRSCNVARRYRGLFSATKRKKWRCIMSIDIPCSGCSIHAINTIPFGYKKPLSNPSPKVSNTSRQHEILSYALCGRHCRVYGSSTYAGQQLRYRAAWEASSGLLMILSSMTVSTILFLIGYVLNIFPPDENMANENVVWIGSCTWLPPTFQLERWIRINWLMGMGCE